MINKGFLFVILYISVQADILLRSVELNEDNFK